MSMFGYWFLWLCCYCICLFFIYGFVLVLVFCFCLMFFILFLIHSSHVLVYVCCCSLVLVHFLDILSFNFVFVSVLVLLFRVIRLLVLLVLDILFGFSASNMIDLPQWLVLNELPYFCLFLYTTKSSVWRTERTISRWSSFCSIISNVHEMFPSLHCFACLKMQLAANNKTGNIATTRSYCDVFVVDG